MRGGDVGSWLNVRCGMGVFAALGGGTSIISACRSRNHPEPIDGFLDTLRNLVERCINTLKNARRVATRYDKTVASYLVSIPSGSARANALISSTSISGASIAAKWSLRGNSVQRVML